MPLSQQDEFGGLNAGPKALERWSQCRSRSKMNSELKEVSNADDPNQVVSMPLSQQDEFGVEL